MGDARLIAWAHLSMQRGEPPTGIVAASSVPSQQSAKKILDINTCCRHTEQMADEKTSDVQILTTDSIVHSR